MVSVLCALVALTGCEPKLERYKIVTQRSVILKIDSETGQSWCWVPNENSPGGMWKSIPNAP